MRLRVFEDPEELAREGAHAFYARMSRDNPLRRVAIALAGGTTPKALYRALAPPHGCVYWAESDVFFGDERCAPEDHPDSNYRMANEVLLSKIPIVVDDCQVGPSIHRVRAELPAEEAAQRYEDEIRRVFKERGERHSAPRFDVILLGLGPDGHTASLFPGSPALHEKERLVVSVHGAPKPPPDRVTFTPRLICAARTIMLLVSGEEKAEALESLMEGPEDIDRTPAQILRHAEGRVSVFADRAAASRLKDRPS